MNKAIFGNAVRHIRRHGCFGALGIYWHALRWKLHRDILHSEFLVRKVLGYRMLLCLQQEGISETLNMHGKREAEHLYILDRVLREGMCVLDIGGNIGYYTLLLASRVGPEGKIYVVEPVPANYRVLEKNVELNGFGGRVEAFQMGISDQTTKRDMTLSQQSNLHTFNEAPKPDVAASLDLSDETIQIPTEDLGTFVEGKRRPELIRMDVEGHEVEILSGLLREAEKRQWFPDILFECHADMYDPETHDIAKPMENLFALGYRPLYMASAKEPASGFRTRGYSPEALVHDPGRERGIYEGVSAADVTAILQEPGQARCLFISHPSSGR
ncbi:MAG: FkbM family methyltransferase [Lentisphaerae bacterium]|jgi:FkbM family methyltransferase|nr:FkbM family methyltransferase [Lentisphaerota bacterium]MBT5607042.1 FkbM family methyltransferase [Lentisphaerota bacterium]MBT7055796.1 FkbM family methyltransferase [Lentisphaerota bacterium]